MPRESVAFAGILSLPANSNWFEPCFRALASRMNGRSRRGRGHGNHDSRDTGGGGGNGRDGRGRQTLYKLAMR